MRFRNAARFLALAAVWGSAFTAIKAGLEFFPPVLFVGEQGTTSAALGESPDAVRWTPGAVLALSYLAVVASALGFLLCFDRLDRLGPIEINLVSYAAPIAAAVTGALLIGETPTATTAAGFLCVLAGFVLTKRRALHEEFDRVRGTR